MLLNWRILRKWLALGIICVTLCWAFYQWGILHALTDSYISEEPGIYVITLDGEEWVHLQS
jgi:hypothetical protein